MIKELDYPSYIGGGPRRISWGAVFAGASTMLAVLAVMTALGAGLGLARAPSPERALILDLGPGSVMWALASGILSFYAGGWIAGRLTDIARVSESVIHGLVSWGAVTTLLTFDTMMVGAPGLVSRAVNAGSGLVGPYGAMDALELATEAGNRGIAGGLAFLMLACGAAAAAYGARNGARALRPTIMPQPQRERVMM